MVPFFHSDLGLYYLIALFYISTFYFFKYYCLPRINAFKTKNTKVLKSFISKRIELPKVVLAIIVFFIKLIPKLILILCLAYFLYCFCPEFYDNYIFYCLQIMLSQPKW